MKIFESSKKGWHGIPEERLFGRNQNITHFYSFLTKSECLKNESNLHMQSSKMSHPTAPIIALSLVNFMNR